MNIKEFCQHLRENGIHFKCSIFDGDVVFVEVCDDRCFYFLFNRKAELKDLTSSRKMILPETNVRPLRGRKKKVKKENLEEIQARARGFLDGSKE